MIKLVVSDIDGTLLPEGTANINPKFYDVVRELKKKGIIFVAASGREFETVGTVMNPIMDDIFCLANNGARILKGGSEEYRCLSLDWELTKEIVTEIRNSLPGVFYSVNRRGGSIMDTCDDKMRDLLVNGYGLDIVETKDVLAEPFDALKISLFAEGDAAIAAIPFIEKFGTRCHVTAAGAHWIDFVHASADKGIALAYLQKMLGIDKEETWVFGDNSNDISMLKNGGTSFAAPGCRPEVAEIADIALQGSLWDSVINQLLTLL